jgi:UDP-N-acetylmuramoylalanine--D-glutamate ligase
MHEAVRMAAELAQPGDAVVLSPACASYDMFQNFGHRGRVFRDAVSAVGAERLD